MAKDRTRRWTPRMRGDRPSKKMRGGSLRRKKKREYYKKRKSKAVFSP